MRSPAEWRQVGFNLLTVAGIGKVCFIYMHMHVFFFTNQTFSEWCQHSLLLEYVQMIMYEVINYPLCYHNGPSENMTDMGK